MAAAAPTASPDGPSIRTRATTSVATLDEQDLSKIRRQILAARNDRRRHESNWRLNLAFCAGKQWLEWKSFGRGGRFVLPALRRGQHRYTVNKISDLRISLLGQFSMDSDRPQLLFRTDDLPTEDFAETANDAVAAGWETEWQGDTVLDEVKRTMIDLGTAAVRCRFDPTAGPKKVKDVPHENGRPILNPEKAREYVAAQQARGQSADLRTIHEGRIRWDHGTPFNLLVPAGIKREDKFPWECWIETSHIDKVKEQYGSEADGITAETIDDINAVGDESSISTGSEDGSDAGTPVKLEDHVFVYTFYERPCRDHPDGRVVVLAGANLKPLEVRPKLDYVAPDGTRRSGIHYFHYIRLTDRFWSQSLIDLVREQQRAYNKRSSQIGETIDRGQAFILAQENGIPKRTGVPVEVIPIKPNIPAPVVSAGVPVGDWMWKSLDRIDADMREASGLQDVLQGENPQNVGNYSQLALLQEEAGRKFDAIMGAAKQNVAHLVEDSVHAIRQYWGADKFLALEGPDGTLKAFNFDATKVPDFYRVYVAKGAAQPRSQAAELKKVDDLAAYSINSGQPLPLEWVAESYDSGKPADMPQQQRHDGLDKALMENQQLEQGGMPQVEYYDDGALHVQVHRSLQSRADATGDRELSQRCEQHIQDHLTQAQANAQAQQTGQQPQNVTGPAAAPPPQVQGNPLLAALQAAVAPHAGKLPPPRPSPYSIFPGSTSAGRSNFGI